METWTPLKLVQWTAGYLEERGFSDPRLNAELLLSGTLGIRRLDLYLQFERPLTAEELADYKARLKRRVRHEPLQYIDGVAAFRELELQVDGRVLIPRPETELLVDRILDWAADREGLDVLDVGTGSGAIALSLAAEGNFRQIVATDASADALDVARVNARRLVPEAAVEFVEGSGYAPVHGRKFDVIVSNPPYIAQAERASLDPEVREWEPEIALFAEKDGMATLIELVDGAPEHLNPGGLLALEIGASQGHAVAALIRNQPSFSGTKILPDLSGRDRIVMAEVLTESVA